ncbi:sigma-E factor negative regulatory protein [Pseudomonadota bacterium]
MTENIREEISALLDDELSHEEIDQTLSQLSEQEQLRSTWDRYNLISDVIRGEAGGRVSPSLADQVRAQVDAEPAILAAPKPAQSAPAWVKPLAGTAVAASVAVLAVMAAPQLLTPDAKISPQVATVKMAEPSYAQLASVPPTQNFHLANSVQYRVRPVVVTQPAARWSTQYSGTRWKNLAKPATENRLNKYLVDHSEYATQAPVRGVVPYATFVGYDARQ